MITLRRTLGLVLTAFTALAAGSACAGDAVRPVVVELYTSQGCSSCPPADALLGKLAKRPDVIAISLPITYWDMLGWKDTLASDVNTRRQKAYAAAMNHGGVYTPQIIVDGVVDVVGSRAANVDNAIAARRAAIQSAIALALARADTARAAADIARAESAGALVGSVARAPAIPARPADPVVPVTVRQFPQEMRIDIGATPGTQNATVWMFHLRASVNVAIAAGENEGHSVTYHNVAGDVRALGTYKGRAMTVTLPRTAMSGLPHDGVAVVVQQDGYGHVIGAAYVARPNFYAAQ